MTMQVTSVDDWMLNLAALCSFQKYLSYPDIEKMIMKSYVQ